VSAVRKPAVAFGMVAKAERSRNTGAWSTQG
jgi:hypothetical protein